MGVSENSVRSGYVSAVRAATRQVSTTSTISASRRRTWPETLDRVSRIAGGLRAQGLGDGDRVGILSQNSDVYLELCLAIPWAGGVVVPLNNRWTPEENHRAILDADMRILVVGDGIDAATIAMATALAGTLALISARAEAPPVGWRAYDALAASAPVEDADRGGDDLFAIFYTGGTTGRAKGVMLSHAGVISNCEGMRALGIFPDGCTGLIVAPLFHLAAVAMMTCAMLAGGAIVLSAGFDPERLQQDVDIEGVTDVLLVPTMVQMLMDHPGFRPDRFDGLRRLVYGASPMAEGTLRRALQHFPRTDFYQAYGMTEASCSVTILPPEYHRGDHSAAGRDRAAGFPLAGTAVRIIDDEGAEQTVGAVGEIAVAGPGVMLGYWGQPELTAATVRNGWLHTGDAGRIDDLGLLYVVDRLKDMIVSGGENVYSGEVESVISKHPGVLQCAVIGLPDSQWGERVHAVVVARPEVTLSADDLIAFARQSIAAYKCPRSVSFLTSPLPVSPAGKVQKQVLRDQAGRDSGREPTFPP